MLILSAINLHFLIGVFLHFIIGADRNAFYFGEYDQDLLPSGSLH
jgi:hypothetical protein